MLSDEEKEAIKNIKKEFEKNHILPDIANEDLGTLLNLIEKQSKEIEEYKKQLDLDYVDKHFVPVERYNQLEKEIEELKEKNEYLPNWVSKKYVSKDKIKAKIEEIEKLKTDDENSIINKIVNWFINQLQSLLEKE